MDTNLEIVIKAQDLASKEIEKVKTQMKGLSEEVKKTGGDIQGSSSAFSGFGNIAKSTFSGVIDGVKTLGVAMVGLGVYGIKLSGNIEQTRVAFDNLYGDTKKAGDMMQKISDFSKVTPFEFPEVADLALKLKNVAGVGDDELIPMLTNLGDIASSQSKPLVQIVEAYNNAITGEFEMLKEFGIKAKSEGDNVSLTFRGQTKTIKNTSGAIGEYLQGIGKMEGVAGAMDMQSRTLNGRLSTLRDTFGNLLKSIVGVSETGEVMKGGFFDKISNGIQELTNWLDKNKEEINEFVLVVTGAFGMMKDIILNTLSQLFTGGSGDFSEFFVGVKKIVIDGIKIITDFWSKYGKDIKFVLTTLFNALKGAFNGFFANIKPVIESALDIIGNIFSIFANLLKGNWKSAFDSIIKILSGFSELAKNILVLALDTISGLFLGTFEELGKKAYNWGTNMVNMMKEGVQDGVEAVGRATLGVADKIAGYLGFGSPTKEGPGKNSDKWMPNLIKMLSYGLIKGWTEIDEASSRIATALGKNLNGVTLKQLTEKLEGIKEVAKSSFDNVKSALEGQKDKIEGLKEEYQSLKDKLKEVGEDGVKELKKLSEQLEKQEKTIKQISGEGKLNVAERALNIEYDLKKLKEEQLKDYKEENNLKIKNLEEELKTARAYAGNEAIEQQRLQNAKTETQLIIEKTNEKIKEAEAERTEIQNTITLKKQAIETEKTEIKKQMDEKKTLMLEEGKIYENLYNTKKTLEKEYFDLFKRNIGETKDEIQGAINQMKLLNNTNEEKATSTQAQNKTTSLANTKTSLASEVKSTVTSTVKNAVAGINTQATQVFNALKNSGVTNAQKLKNLYDEGVAKYTGNNLINFKEGFKNYVNSLQGKAIGGHVNGGQSYIVGEKGPELFTPNKSGNITPNNKLGGGSTINLNFGNVSINNGMDLNSFLSIVKKTVYEEQRKANLGLIM